MVTVCLILLSIACAGYVLAAPGEESQGVSVHPSQAYTGEPIEISLRGFLGDYLVPAGAMSLAGLRIAIPGTFDNPGVRPRTDSEGNVSFTTLVPLGTPIGPQNITVTNFADGRERRAAITVLGADLAFTPAVTSPNQAVVLHGSGLSPATSAGGHGPLGVHQITGEGPSGITVNNNLLDAPYVTYPINLDSDGGLTVSMILPESYVSLPRRTLEVGVVDDTGRSGTTMWIVSDRKITLSPPESGRGSKVTVTGAGFSATGGPTTQCTAVRLSYGGTVLSNLTPDSTGSFETTIKVPQAVDLSSSNEVKASIPACPSAPIATATHKVPARSIKVVPQGSPVNTVITVVGVSFVGFTQNHQTHGRRHLGASLSSAVDRGRRQLLHYRIRAPASHRKPTCKTHCRGRRVFLSLYRARCTGYSHSRPDTNADPDAHTDTDSDNCPNPNADHHTDGCAQPDGDPGSQNGRLVDVANRKLD